MNKQTLRMMQILFVFNACLLGSVIGLSGMEGSPKNLDAKSVNRDLNRAAKEGNIDVVKSFLTNKETVQLISKKGAMETLGHAAKKGNLVIVNLILEKLPALLDAKSIEAAIWKASRKGNPEVVKVLLGFAKEQNLLDITSLENMKSELKALFQEETAGRNRVLTLFDSEIEQIETPN